MDKYWKRKWEKELKMINGLAKMYPVFKHPLNSNVLFHNYEASKPLLALWVYYLCKYGLEQRIPSLERFIRKHGVGDLWFNYMKHFGMIKE